MQSHVNSPNLVYFPINVSASGDNTISTYFGADGLPVASATVNARRLRILNLTVIAAGAVTFAVKADGINRIGPISLPADGAGWETGFDEVGFAVKPRNCDLVLNLGGAVQVGGVGIGILE
jgi:hypothetical protein